MISNSDQYIVVNYHFVLNPEDRPDLGGIFPCLPETFSNQLKWLKKNFTLTAVDEVYRAAREKRSGRFCALTFDDGTRDHLEIVFPLLREQRAPGTFFVITGPFEGKMPTSHKIYRLRSELTIPELIDHYNNFSRNPMPTDKFIDPTERYDDLLTSNFKTTIARLPHSVANEFMNVLFSQLGWDENLEARKLFLMPEDIVKMKSGGMKFGAHGDSHNPFPVLKDDEVANELRNSKRILVDLLGEEVHLFSYPHGQYRRQHPKLIEDFGFHYAATTERRSINGIENKFLLPRFDANDLKDIQK
ncbi:MAG: polysaccharide deacetylase family protein [Candidatus Harrisonbacteria bacterium]|nr:polysaccharide deacetylase family protein [Candidatus Harrisonbacteria bacterium]